MSDGNRCDRTRTAGTGALRLLCILLMLCAAALVACGNGGADRPTSVFLITIDTLRADHWGCYGYPRDTSPFVDELASKGVLFENAIAASATTAPAHASILTGLNPVQHHVVRNGQRLDDSLFTLADMFHEEGYRTAAFTSVRFASGLGHSFRYFDGQRRRGGKTVQAVSDWIAKEPVAGDESLFLWVHLFDPHLPYNSSDTPFFKELDGTPLRQQRGFLDFVKQTRQIPEGHFVSDRALLKAYNGYDAEIRYTDDLIRRLYGILEEAGLNSNALWVILADHGEGMGSHDFRGHGRFIYNEQIRVPLILYWSGDRLAPRRVTALTRQVDILPTLADLMRYPLDDKQAAVAFVGASFLPLVLGERDEIPEIQFAYAERAPRDVERRKFREEWEEGSVYSLQSLEHKYIYHSHGQDEFFDLVRDPLELTNLLESPEPPAEHDRMKGLLAQWHAEWTESGSRITPGGIEEEHIEELKALGYINQ